MADLPAGRSSTTVGIFGAQRDDQGRLVVGRVIARCLQAGFEGFDADGQDASRGAEGPSRPDTPGLRWRFPSKIERSDLVVAPYRWDLYSGGRGSGIISQAIASGIPCVAPYRSKSRPRAGAHRFRRALFRAPCGRCLRRHSPRAKDLSGLPKPHPWCRGMARTERHRDLSM